MSEALQGTGIRTTRAGVIDEYGAFIPGSYLASPHQHGDLEAIVTHEGKPIMERGEVLTIGKCPAQYRWAIGEVQDGQAEVIPQHIFKDRLMTVDQEYYAFHEQRYDKDANLIPVPRVERFVARKIEPNEKKIVPLGFGRPAPDEGQPSHLLYSPANDALIEKEAAELAEKEAKVAESSAKDSIIGQQVETISELRQQLDEQKEFMSRLQEATESETAGPHANKTNAPCGKEVHAKRVYAHAMRCKDPRCKEYDEERIRDNARKAEVEAANAEEPQEE